MFRDESRAVSTGRPGLTGSIGSGKRRRRARRSSLSDLPPKPQPGEKKAKRPTRFSDLHSLTHPVAFFVSAPSFTPTGAGGLETALKGLQFLNPTVATPTTTTVTTASTTTNLTPVVTKLDPKGVMLSPATTVSTRSLSTRGSSTNHHIQSYRRSSLMANDGRFHPPIQEAVTPARLEEERGLLNNCDQENSMQMDDFVPQTPKMATPATPTVPQSTSSTTKKKKKKKGTDSTSAKRKKKDKSSTNTGVTDTPKGEALALADSKKKTSSSPKKKSNKGLVAAVTATTTPTTAAATTTATLIPKATPVPTIGPAKTAAARTTTTTKTSLSPDNHNRNHDRNNTASVHESFNMVDMNGFAKLLDEEQEDDSFAPDNSWEDGTFKSFNTRSTIHKPTPAKKKLTKTAAYSSSEEFGFGSVKRNETFRRKQANNEEQNSSSCSSSKKASSTSSSSQERFSPKTPKRVQEERLTKSPNSAGDFEAFLNKLIEDAKTPHDSLETWPITSAKASETSRRRKATKGNQQSTQIPKLHGASKDRPSSKSRRRNSNNRETKNSPVLPQPPYTIAFQRFKKKSNRVLETCVETKTIYMTMTDVLQLLVEEIDQAKDDPIFSRKDIKALQRGEKQAVYTVGDKLHSRDEFVDLTMADLLQLGGAARVVVQVKLETVKSVS